MNYCYRLTRQLNLTQNHEFFMSASACSIALIQAKQCVLSPLSVKLNCKTDGGDCIQIARNLQAPLALAKFLHRASFVGRQDAKIE